MIKENLNAVLNRIRECEIKYSRKSGSVKLCAVSKFHPEDSVLEAFDAGQNLFGENRVQEAAAKFDSIRSKGINPELHIIGSLQRNKVKEAVRIASCIQSVDRIELVQEIQKQCEKQNKTIDVLFELHTGEESKSGFDGTDGIKRLLELIADGTYGRLIPKGLMTMAPATDDKNLIRKSFSTLRTSLEELNSDFPEFGMTELSMGMSGDFETAIEEGSTMVRVGTAIFGERNYSK